MKKRNGFTLVELLGVIVVLAILALITIPIISNVINDVRIKSLESSAYGLIEASNLYYAQYGVNSNTRFDIDNNKINSNDTDILLKYKGSVKEGTVILDRKGSVTVCITDGKNSAYKNYNETKVTTVKGKCEIKANSNIVYLDDEATIDSYDNIKLTELVNSMQEEINELKNDLSSTNNKISTLENNSTTIDEIYPIGSIYISTTDNTVEKVQNRFGGTWVVYGSGRTLMSSTSASEQTGGSQTATITPTGTVGNTTLTVNQMPSHVHNIKTGIWGGDTFVGAYHSNVNDNGLSYEDFGYKATSKGKHTTWHADYTGGSQPHTHTFTGNSTPIDTVSPYITVYMYKRTS